IVIRLRVRRSMPSPAQSVPHAVSVMKCWKGASNGVAAAAARSTCAPPSTSRRTRMPRSCRDSSDMLEAHVVLGQARGRGARAAHVAELRELEPLVEWVVAGRAMQHGRHPPGEMFDAPDAP